MTGKMRRNGNACLVAMLLCCGLFSQRPTIKGESSCIVCHPAAARALASSAHMVLLQRADAAIRSCTACHGDLTRHVTYEAQPNGKALPVPQVTAIACAECHRESEYLPAAGQHVAEPLPASAAMLPDPTAGVLQTLDRRASSTGFQWSGLLDFGYRFASIKGSEDNYDTDINLSDGVRLHTLETRLLGGGKAFANELSLEAHDVGDPNWDARTRLKRENDYEAGASYQRYSYQYLATGDFHRVNLESTLQDYSTEVFLSSDVRAFYSFARSNDEGFWLTQRIGNRNVNVQPYIDGVQNPRDYESDTSTAGLSGNLGGWLWTAAADYIDERGLDQFSYDQPAPANPAFNDSEEFASQTTLRGPGAKFALSRDIGSWSFDFTGRFADHSRILNGTGQSAGFDVTQFTTSTTAEGSGTATTWMLDGGSTYMMTDTLRARLDLHWRDHRENFLLQQTVVTTLPALGTQQTIVTNLDQRTNQQILDGAVALEWDLTKMLTLTLGFGGSRESLSVPSLDLNDPNDYRSGTVRDRGLVAGFDWRFADNWRLRGDLRDFGQDGVYLNELAPEKARVVSGNLSYSQKTLRAATFFKHRYIDNQVSDHQLDYYATGLHLGVTKNSLSLDADYTFAHTDTSTLTNFYFDPDPTPRATYVGFVGDTHTVATTFAIEPSAGLHWELTAVWTDTIGSTDLGTMDWRAGMRVDVVINGAAGVEYRQINYREDGSSDNYEANLLWLYWRQTF